MIFFGGFYTGFVSNVVVCVIGTFSSQLKVCHSFLFTLSATKFILLFSFVGVKIKIILLINFDFWLIGTKKH